MHPLPLTATYRLQLNKDFPLAEARAIVPYLDRLGVSHLYSSPILAARPGSTHGYDVVDPSKVNPELGGEVERRALVEALHARGMGLVLDIVPNHMGTGHVNPYWDDVLARGRSSRYARWFDIDWAAADPKLRGRVLVPVLGDALDAVLARDEVRLAYEGGVFRVRYYDHSFPVDPATVHRVFAFEHAYDYPRGEVDAERAHEHGRSLAEEIMAIRAELIPSPADADEAGLTFEQRRQRSERALARLAGLVERSPSQRGYLDFVVREFQAGEDGRYRLRALLDLQPYSLAHWERAAKEINYRRFFDINDLVALHAEDPAVFEETHALPLAWVADGSLSGLRVDHIDGILDPLAYLRRLREAVHRGSPGTRGWPAGGGRVPTEGGQMVDGDGDFVPVFVEKILSPGEHLRPEWPVQGTTGYEFLNDLEAIFIDPEGARAVERTYRDLLPPGRRAHSFHDVARQGKLDVLRGSLTADVRRLSRQLLAIARRGERTRGLSLPDLQTAVVEYIAALPVYRTYIDGRAGGPGAEDRAVVERTIAAARAHGVATPAALDLLADILLDSSPADAARLHFALRLQQASGPATAKGVEDTALYRYSPLLSRNEVGSDPTRPLADAVDVLHRASAERVERLPHALICVNTHDTKRSSGVRARVDVLTEVPELWRDCVTRWSRAHRPLKRMLGRRRVPDVYSEYLLYQTVVGVWPSPPAGAPAEWLPSDGDLTDVRERVGAYMLKAVRESKSRTSWTQSDADFGAALADFVNVLLGEERGRSFRTEVGRLVARVARPGLWNDLSRTLIHLASPGTPDLYQGDELWSFSLVDPDNRRPVDYRLRDRLLTEVEQGFAGEEGRPGFLADLVARVEDGRIKLHLVHRLLRARRERPGLFRDGDYVPVVADGPRRANLFAFARRQDDQAIIAVVPRLTSSLDPAGAAPVGDVWEGTSIRLPPGLPGGSAECLLTGRRLRLAAGGEGGTLSAAELFATFPVSLLALSSAEGGGGDRV